MTCPEIFIITTKNSLKRLIKITNTLHGHDYEVTPLLAYSRDDPKVTDAYDYRVTKDEKASAERSHRITLADKLIEYGTKGLPLTILEDDCVFDKKPEFISLPKDYSLVIHGTYLRSKPTIVSNYDNFYEIEGSFPMWGAHAVTYSPGFALRFGKLLLEQEKPLVDLLLGEVETEGKYIHIPQYAWQDPTQKGMHGGFNFNRLRMESNRTAARALLEYKNLYNI